METLEDLKNDESHLLRRIAFHKYVLAEIENDVIKFQEKNMIDSLEADLAIVREKMKTAKPAPTKPVGRVLQVTPEIIELCDIIEKKTHEFCRSGLWHKTEICEMRQEKLAELGMLIYREIKQEDVE